MPEIQPALPDEGDIRALLAGRVDVHRLSRGVVVGVTEAGEHRFVSYGHTDASLARAVGADTLFEIGSITKLFTALLLADMAGRREVALDERVAALLPEGGIVPARNGRDITLLDLVSHRAGLPRMPSNFGLAEQTDPDRPFTPDMLYAFLSEHELARTPGDVEVYSNLGYGLLGHALARRAGLAYPELVRARVLVPLAMHRTTIAVTPDLAPSLAVGHDDALEAVPAWQFGTMESAGAFRSSASDMLLFADALCDPGRSPLVDQIATVFRPLGDGGFGRGAPHPDAGQLLSHAGGTGGFRAHLGCIPAWRRGVAVLSNAVTEITADLGIHVLDSRYRLMWHRTEVPVDPGHLARLVGRYRLTPDLFLDVAANGGRLTVQLTGQRAFAVFPTSDWTFFYKCVGAQLTFEPGPDGRAVRMILHQNGLDQMAERTA